MTTHDEIEARLVRALSVEPSADGLRWLDQRVEQLLARPVINPRRGARRGRTILRPLAAALAILALAGGVTAGVGLVERMLESAPGWRTAYEEAVILGSSQTDAGLALTLERAYADLNQVVVFLTMEGLAAPRSRDGVATDHLAIVDASLRDRTGRAPVMMTAITGVEPGLAAAAHSFQFDSPIVEAATYVLTITSIGYGGDGPDCVSPCVHDEIAGTWRFEFTLPEPRGTVVRPEASATVGSTTLRLTELRVSPTMVTARIALFVDDRPAAYWAFIPSDRDLVHDGNGFGLWSARHVLDEAPFEHGPTVEFSTSVGFDDASGTWEIVIPELDYGMTNDEMIHLSGPWRLRVTVP